MEKESKVKQVVPFAQKEGAKDYTFSIEFENGDHGFYHNPTANQDYFVLGSLVKYELEEKEKKDKSGKYYVIYKPGGKAAADAANKKPYNRNDRQPKTAIEVKRECRPMVARYAVDMAIQGIIQVKEIPANYKALINMVDESIDKMESGTVATV